MNGDRLEITIADTGPGIPAEVLPQVLEPLFSTKSFGTGLGLPTVQQIIEAHGGGLEISSEENRGTTVVLWLPLNRSVEEGVAA
jgi:signal transduction histidine kinase